MMLTAMMMTVMATFSACSTEEMTADGNAAQKALFTVGDFPTYSTDATTRTIGTADEGKTAWAAGDVILVKAEQYSGYDATNNVVSGTVSKTTLYKMTCTAAASTGTDPTWTTEQYIGSEWTTPTGLTAGSYEEGLKITAYYAPNYEWDTTSNALKLISGKTAGTAEKLSVSEQKQFVKFGSKSIAIDFSGATRTYSRLRIAAVPNATIAFTCAGFTPVGTSAALGNTAVSLTTDAKGNAYMYGSWTASTMAASITVDGKSYSLASKSVTTVPEANKSYALNAIPTGCKQIGAGDATSPYRIYNATQLQDMSTNGLTDHYFKLESDINWPTTSNFSPIGNAVNHFTGNFDGDGHSISNLTISGDNETFATGLFGYYAPAKGYSLKNVTLKNPNITTSYTNESPCIGALCGFMYNAYLFKLENCHVIGGFINYTGGSATASVGGLVGEIVNEESRDGCDFSVLGCSADASVTCASTISGEAGAAGIGGLIGLSANVSPLTIKGSFFHGSVYTPSTSHVGLVYGLSDFTPTVTSVYYQSTMTGTNYVTTESNANATKVDGTTTTWSTAVTNMNTAISSDITGYQYVLKEGARCPVMEKK
jgi:hypothetical protein